jgi:MerR family transcriptional regulator/heat shock protein HspR
VANETGDADLEPNQNLSDPVMSIGTLAEKVGLSDSAIRKYENASLLIAHRTPSGHRRFCHEDIDRVRNIQRMIQDLGVSIEGIRRLQAMLPCWDLLPCSSEKREKCPAFQDNTKPCWMVKGLDCTPSHGNECRQCVIYRFGSLCTEEIKSLVYDQANSKDASTAIRELMDRKRRCGKEG